MATAVIIKDAANAEADADELKKNADKMKNAFDDLGAKLKGYVSGPIRLDWMDTVVENYQQYNENDIKAALAQIVKSAGDIQVYVKETLAYSHEEQV